MTEVCEPMVGGGVSPIQENLIHMAGDMFGDKGTQRPRPRPLPIPPQPPRPPR